MKNAFLPLVALLALLLVPTVSSRQRDVQPKTFWLTVYTYTLPKGLSTEGEHTYQFDFNFTEPKPGSLEGRLRKVTVSNQAPLYSGYTLLRPGGVQAYEVDGQLSGCETLKQINPGQPVKFMVAWTHNERLTEEQTRQQIQSMKATVRWDNQPPVEMTVEAAPQMSWEPLWNCRPWVNTTANELSTRP